jgi:hypothetical protein
MKKLVLVAIALVSFGMFVTPKAEAGVYIGIGLPVFPVYPAYYPGYYYGPYPYYYGHPYGYYGYGHIYNGHYAPGRVTRSTRDHRSSSDK